MTTSDDMADDAAGARPGRLTSLGATTIRLARRAADVIVPPLCLGCGRPMGSHDGLCAACWRQVRFIRPPLCDRLGIPMPYDTGGPVVSAAALADPPAWNRARAVAHFDGVVRDLVHTFKYADRHDARRLLGRWLTSAGAELLVDADMLVPVPLNRWRLLSRKFNQAAILAQEVSRIAHVPCEPLLLERIKATRAQVGLSQAERRQNLSGAFRVAPAVAASSRLVGRRVVLVDDVITTGSTVAACARVLSRAGAARVDVLAVAMVTDLTRIGM